MKLKELRASKGLQQRHLADLIGKSVPMMSYIENYLFLPIPETLKKICEVLDCDVLDIYEKNEIYISAQKRAKTETKETPSVYKLSVRLPNEAREKFTQENLEKCGYHSLKDYIYHCYKRFSVHLAYIEAMKKEPLRSHPETAQNGTKDVPKTQLKYTTDVTKSQFKKLKRYKSMAKKVLNMPLSDASIYIEAIRRIIGDEEAEGIVSQFSEVLREETK